MTESKFIQEIIKVSGDMWVKGWAERNAGNISLRIKKEEIEDDSQLKFDGEWLTLSKKMENLAGEYFLVTGTGRFLRNIQVFPEKNLGIIEIDDSGAKYRIIWGYEGGGAPTSELPSHLLAHSVRKSATNGEDRVIIHTHPANLIALTYARELDTVSLSRLMWEMHAECVVVFPNGVEYLPWIMAGTDEIADATAKAFLKRDIVVWEYHGVFASGRNLDTAFGLIDTVEKASEIYIKAESIGGVVKKFTLEQIDAIARNFGPAPAEDIFSKLK